jgi:hypothetical protein
MKASPEPITNRVSFWEQGWDVTYESDRLRGLVVRVSSYSYQISWEVVGLEQGSLSLVKITEELLEWKVVVPGLENRD